MKFISLSDLHLLKNIKCSLLNIFFLHYLIKELYKLYNCTNNREEKLYKKKYKKVKIKR